MEGDFKVENEMVEEGIEMVKGVKDEDEMSELEIIKGEKGRIDIVGEKEDGEKEYVDYENKKEELENVMK